MCCRTRPARLARILIRCLNRGSIMRTIRVIAFKTDGTEKEVARTDGEHAVHYVAWLKSDHFKAAVAAIKAEAAAKGEVPKFLDVEDCVFGICDLEGATS